MYTEGTEVQLQLFFTSALHGGQWSTSRPGRFTLGKEPLNPLNRGLGWRQSQYERLRAQKIVLPLPGFEHQDVQLAENRMLEYLGRKITLRTLFTSKQTDC
jgi:hypothetical protein